MVLSVSVKVSCVRCSSSMPQLHVVFAPVNCDSKLQMCRRIPRSLLRDGGTQWPAGRPTCFALVRHAACRSRCVNTVKSIVCPHGCIQCRDVACMIKSRRHGDMPPLAMGATIANVRQPLCLPGRSRASAIAVRSVMKAESGRTCEVCPYDRHHVTLALKQELGRWGDCVHSKVALQANPLCLCMPLFGWVPCASPGPWAECEQNVS
jgi:hypothetical protein